ncbi:MAG: alpha/beta hydrolase [Actinobacteria bacterium]|nr:alpha/beta hydrolase [Actinomycetota bacterium]
MAPTPVWPGEFVSLGETAVYVRTAPATLAATSTATNTAAEPVLCVHGFGGSSTNWTDLMALLSDPAASGPDAPAYRCEALDLPGFGFSAPAEASCTVSGQAALVAQLIEHRGRGPVHLVGNSFGGAVCTRVAATRPDLIKTVTLVAPAMPDLWVRPVTARFPALCVPKFGSWLLNRVQKMSAQARVEASIATIYYDGRCVHPDRIAADVAETERRDTLAYGDAVLIRCARSIVAEYLRLGRHSLWRDAARVEAPALVIYGSHDKIVDPRMAGRAARSFPRGRVVVLPRTGHVAQMERPEAVAAEFRQMVSAPEQSYDLREPAAVGNALQAVPVM